LVANVDEALVYEHAHGESPAKIKIKPCVFWQVNAHRKRPSLGLGLDRTDHPPDV
jgi:hypothetical protein